MREADDRYEEHVPDPGKYYMEYRTKLFSQGDIFINANIEMPTTPPSLWREYVMLITPTGFMRTTGPIVGQYTAMERTVVPIVPLAVYTEPGQDVSNSTDWDGSWGCIYLPPHPDDKFPESLAMLFLPQTVRHDDLMGSEGISRVTQLTKPAAQQLCRQLVWFAGGRRVPRAEFDPPMD
jgi:hypothetical protein